MLSKLKVPVQLRNEKVGTLFYQLPYPTRIQRQYRLGFLLLGKALRMRKERGLFRKFFFEILALISFSSYAKLLKKRILVKAKNNVIWLKQKHARQLVIQKISKKKMASAQQRFVFSQNDSFESQDMKFMRLRRESKKHVIEKSFSKIFNF